MLLIAAEGDTRWHRPPTVRWQGAPKEVSPQDGDVARHRPSPRPVSVIGRLADGDFGEFPSNASASANALACLSLALQPADRFKCSIGAALTFSGIGRKRRDGSTCQENGSTFTYSPRRDDHDTTFLHYRLPEVNLRKLLAIDQIVLTFSPYRHR